MQTKSEIGLDLANLVDSYEMKSYEVSKQKSKLKRLRKEQRELKQELLLKLMEYRKFI